MTNFYFILTIAGVLSGAVNFFTSYVELPYKGPSLVDTQPTKLKDIWWVAVLGYIVTGICGAFLTPVINALLDGLKGLDLLNRIDKTHPKYLNEGVLLGYGLIFGYSTTRLLNSLFDAISKRVSIVEAKLNKVMESESKKTKPLSKIAIDIINSCEANFDAYKSDCSGFVKAVGSDFSVSLTGDADDIIDQITGKDWTKLKDGVEAKERADAGWFVVGGLKSNGNVPPQSHGHVVVVVSGEVAFNKYPTAYWGKLGGVGEKNKTINFAWNRESRDKVIYCGRVIQ